MTEFEAQLSQRAFLLQPELFWSNGDVTEQGTAFVVKLEDGRHFAVTSAHFLNLEGPLLERVQLRNIASDAVVAAPESSWGRPGSGGVDNPITDLSEDLLILPLESDSFAKVANIVVRDVPELIVGQSILLPNRQPDSPHGHLTLKGKIAEVDAGFVRVTLDAPMTLVSQSGSPVLTATGELVGVVSRGFAHDDGQVSLLLTPAHAVFRNVTSPTERFPLRNVVGKAGVGEQVALRYQWKPGMRLPMLYRKHDDRRDLERSIHYAWLTEAQGDGIRISGSEFTWKGPPISEETNELLISVMSATPAFSVDATGAFSGMDDPAAAIERLLPAVSPEAAKKAMLSASPKFIRAAMEMEWAGRVSMWIDADPVIGTAYELKGEGQAPIGDFTLPMTTHFMATHRTACTPDDGARSCVMLTTHTTYDPQALKVAILGAMLAHLAPEEHEEAKRAVAGLEAKATVRTVVVTRPESLIPAHFLRETHFAIPGKTQKRSYRLVEWLFGPPVRR